MRNRYAVAQLFSSIPTPAMRNLSLKMISMLIHCVVNTLIATEASALLVLFHFIEHWVVSQTKTAHIAKY